MNCIRQRVKTFYIAALLALFILATGAAVPAQAQTYRVLYTFGNVSLDPLQPGGIAEIAQGRDGNLYSTSTAGGVGNVGTLFNMSPSGAMTLVFSFNYNPGNDPLSGVTLGSDGNYYGTTKLNGEGPGTAWQVTPTGTGKALHYFGNSGDGACPWAGQVEGTDGNYYGTTSTVCGFGSLSTIYKLTSSGALTTLYTFTDGSNLTAPLIQGTDGNFYGVTESGGANGDGAIFKMTPSGTVTTLHSFDGSDGNQAYTALIQATDGNLYGVTYMGGTSNQGVVFKSSTTGTYTVLHNFTGSSTDGGEPWGLTQASNGTLYGAAQIGGASNVGTLYSISTGGTFKLLFSFGGANGEFSAEAEHKWNSLRHHLLARKHKCVRRWLRSLLQPEYRRQAVHHAVEHVGQGGIEGRHLRPGILAFVSGEVQRRAGNDGHVVRYNLSDRDRADRRDRRESYGDYRLNHADQHSKVHGAQLVGERGRAADGNGAIVGSGTRRRHLCDWRSERVRNCPGQRPNLQPHHEHLELRHGAADGDPT